MLLILDSYLISTKVILVAALGVQPDHIDGGRRVTPEARHVSCVKCLKSKAAAS